MERMPNNRVRSRRSLTIILVTVTTLAAVTGIYLTVSATDPASYGTSDIPLANKKDLPAYKVAAVQETARLEARANAVTPAPKAGVTDPGPAAPMAQGDWGVLAADVGPVPIPSRIYTVQNKWLGEVNGTFTAVYVGAATQNPQQGFLAVFQPDNGTPIAYFRPQQATGALTIDKVDGSVVSFHYQGGTGTFNLTTHQFQF